MVCWFFLILVPLWFNETGQIWVSWHFPEKVCREWSEILHADVTCVGIFLMHQVLSSSFICNRNDPSRFALLCWFCCSNTSLNSSSTGVWWDTKSIHSIRQICSITSCEPLWLSIICWHKSILSQVMACCLLTALSHYWNQCWLIISKVLSWHSS